MDVPVAALDGIPDDSVRIPDPVEGLELPPESFQDFHGLVPGRFLDLDLLEQALEVLAAVHALLIILEGRSPDESDVPPFDIGDEEARRIAGTVAGASRSDDLVDIVDEKDDIPFGSHSVQDLLHPALEVAPELGSGDNGGEIKRIQLFPLQAFGDIPFLQQGGEPADDGGLPHPVLADENRVALLLPAKDQQGPGDLFLPADEAPVLLHRQGTAGPHPGFLRLVFRALVFRSGGIVGISLIQGAEQIALSRGDILFQPEGSITVLELVKGVDDMRDVDPVGTGLGHLDIGHLEDLHQLVGQFQLLDLPVGFFDIGRDVPGEVFPGLRQRSREPFEHRTEPFQGQEPLQEDLGGNILRMVFSGEHRRLVQRQLDAGCYLTVHFFSSGTMVKLSGKPFPRARDTALLTLVCAIS